jgi:Co/Zn/Cd efflux system component
MHTPSNIIITIVGFFMAYGAVGTLDADPTASVVKMFALACVGLCLMTVGTMGLTQRQ